MKRIDIISIALISISILIFLYFIFYYQSYSPEFLTHQEFYTAMSGIAIAFFSGLLGIWIQVSNKLTDFAKELGELKGTIGQYIKNHPVRRKK